MSSGKVCSKMLPAKDVNDVSGKLRNRGKRSGTMVAVATLISKVYVTVPATLPFSFSVTTAAAVAVGQIRHNMAASIQI